MSIIEKILILVMIALGLIAVGAKFKPAASQNATSGLVFKAPCATTAETVAYLAGSQYAEERQTVAVDAQGNLVSTWENLETGTWTLTLTLTDGRTCVVLSGEGGINKAPKVDPAKVGEPS